MPPRTRSRRDINDGESPNISASQSATKYDDSNEQVVDNIKPTQGKLKDINTENGDEEEEHPVAWQDKWTLTSIVVSFWIAVFMGLPYWYSTTSVERLHLPFDQIDSWQNKQCPAHLTVSYEFAAEDLRPVNNLAVSSDHRLNGIVQYRNPEVCLNNIVVAAPRGKRAAQDVTYRVTFHHDDDIDDASINLMGDGHDVQVISNEILDAPKDRSRLKHPGSRQGAFDQILARLSYLSEQTLPGAYSSNKDSSVTSITNVDSRVVKPSRSYKLVFSLLLQDANHVRWKDWQINHAISRSVTPFLEQLSTWNVSFTIETQIQYIAPLTVPLKHSYNEELNTTEWILEQDQLKAFVNSADWNLGSMGSTDVVLHFLLYVPSRGNSPLYIYDKIQGKRAHSNAFLRPQWGGVVIMNDDEKIANDIDEGNANDGDVLRWKDLKKPFEIFSRQMSVLFGLSSTAVTTFPEQAVHIEGTRALAGWRIDAIGRKRIIEDVNEAIRTLSAMKKLVQEQANMRVSQKVKSDVEEALGWLDEVDRLCSDKTPGRGGKEWMTNVAGAAGAAAQAANRAFFNPTMVSLLYFPDEHKYAVYTPLFGPVAMPLVVGAVKTGMKIWKRQRRRREHEKTE